jgi:hypothetical protein
MLHAWIWSPNPAGMFAADNWAIPLLRLKLSAVASSPTVGKAVALAVGGRAYFEMVIAAAGSLSPAEKARVTAAVDRAESAVRQIIQELEGPVLSEVHRVNLASVWSQLWNSIDASLTGESKRELVNLPIR